MKWIWDDGGRKAAGIPGSSGDCVTRAISIATGKPYREVFTALDDIRDNFMVTLRKSRAKRGIATSNARTGVDAYVWRKYLDDLGWKWHATMRIGSGCRVHMRAAELPAGRLIVRCSRHLACVIDGVLHDTHDCSRRGTRCVYGFYLDSKQVPFLAPPRQRSRSTSPGGTYLESNLTTEEK